MSNRINEFFSSDKIDYLQENIDLITNLLNSLKQKIDSSDNIEVIKFLINYYSEKKELFEQPLINLYAIIISNNKERIPDFIKNWENEIDLLKEEGKFEFKIIDIDEFNYKKIR